MTMDIHQKSSRTGLRILLPLAAAVLLGLATRQTVEAQIPSLAESPSLTPPPTGDSTQPQLQEIAGVPPPDATTWHSMITNVPGDLVYGVSGIASSTTLQAIGGLGVLTCLLVATDPTTNRATQQLIGRNPWMGPACTFFEQVGNGRTHLGVAAAFALGGLIANDSRALRTASQTVEGLLVTGVVVQALKHVTGRESPAAASSSAGVWRFFPNLKAYYNNQPKFYAFPSGHVATTMTTVTVIAENYPEQLWIRPVGYGIVGLVGVGLSGVKFHWYSDLPVGIALGYAFGKIVARHDQPGDGDGDPGRVSRVSVVPSFSPYGPGVTLGITL